MERPSQDTRNDIYKSYIDEYIQTQTKDRPGIAGAVNRVFARLSSRADGSTRAIMALVSGGGTGWLLQAAGKWIPPVADFFKRSGALVAVGMGAATMLAAGLSELIVNLGARNKLIADIDAGALDRRYLEEILRPRQAKTADTAARLESGLSGTFNSEPDEPVRSSALNEKPPAKTGPANKG